jgi:hypothetical protein
VSGAAGLPARRGGIMALAIAMAMAGCAADPQPRTRIGCLPFPGLFTLFTLADPDDLGVHRYDAWPDLRRDEGEVERGIVYTCRAGFVDIAHLRLSADWMRCLSGRVEGALRERRERAVVADHDGTTVTVTLRYPPEWDGLPSPQRERLARELGHRAGAHLAWIVMTWHEIITWFGYRSTVILPEDGSAFTYDDVVAHLVGIRVADRALRDHALPFDDAVTEAIDVELTELGVVPKADAMRAIEAVEGDWWSGGTSRKRQLDFDLESGEVEPWVVPGAAGCDGVTEVFALPPLDDVEGFDFRRLMTVEIKTTILEAARIRAVVPGAPHVFRPADHFGPMIEHIRAVESQRLGPGFDRPVAARGSAR